MGLAGGVALRRLGKAPLTGSPVITLWLPSAEP